VSLSAVQLFTGFAESGETLRSTGLSYDYAAMFSFPPENLLTLVAPNFFGDMMAMPYWGRCYLWEMCGFVSVTGLVLAALGACCRSSAGFQPAVSPISNRQASGNTRPAKSSARFAGSKHSDTAVWKPALRAEVVSRKELLMVVISLVLALGAHTPIFNLLYHWAPGFNKFRGSSKFIFLAALFLAMLAAGGLDRILRRGGAPQTAVIGTFVTALLLAVTSLAVRQSALGGASAAWSSALAAVPKTHESYVPDTAYSDPAIIFKTGQWAAGSLLVSAGTLCALGLVLALTARYPKLIALVVVLGVAELFVFARKSRDTCELALAVPPQLSQPLAEAPGDYRILNLVSPNAAMSLGAREIWGYDPGVLRRYAEFMAFTQEINPDDVTQYIPFSHDHALYGMLRRRFMFVPGSNGRVTIYDNTNVAPRMQLLQNFRVIPQRNEMFAAMTNAAFNPLHELYLESPPDERRGWRVEAGNWSAEQPPGAGAGTVRVVEDSTDYASLEADLPSPAILLITDAYSAGWRARVLPGSSQLDYQVMPANYSLRAIPLAAGHHRLRMEYRPRSFVWGKWVSLVSVAAFLCLVAVWAARFRRNSVRK
jgi:hypothetical protein